jgi:6-phosphogluconolactonase
MEMRVRALLTSMVVLVTISLVGCGHYTCGVTFGSSTCTPSGGTGPSQGGGSTNGTAAAFDYYFDVGALKAASLDTSNNFAVISNFVSPPQASSGIGGSLVVQRKWLYVALNGSLNIEAYSINGTTGALTAIAGSPYGSLDTNAITSDPAGQFLFLCGADDDEVSVFAINQTDGSLTQVGSYPAGVGFAEQATTDGLGRFLYVTAGNLGSEVGVFSIGSTGALTAVAGSPFAISIAELASEPTGKFLLGVTGNGANNGFPSDDHVYVYSINQTTGVITPAPGSPFATTFTPANLAVHPNGTLVYTFNQTIISTSPMEGFQFNTTTGALTALGVSPFTSLTAPFGMFDQNGAFLFMRPGATLTVAGVDTTTGALTSIGTPIQTLGSAGNFVVTDPH